jgi:hypothetical protein
MKCKLGEHECVPASSPKPRAGGTNTDAALMLLTAVKDALTPAAYNLANLDSSRLCCGPSSSLPVLWPCRWPASQL